MDSYEKAIERARELVIEGKISKENAEYIFPELKEPGDERIRKFLIDFIKVCGWSEKQFPPREDAIAWLEKQGEHANFRNKIQVGDEVTRNEDGVLVNLSQLNRVAKKYEKQAQKPTEDEDREYAYQSPEHYTRRELMIYNLGIYNGKKMVEDAIEETIQNPAWSEGDDTMLNEIIASVNGFDATSGTTTMNFGKHEAKINWLKTIKYKALAQLSDKWSEEDEISLSDIIKCLEEHKHCMLTEEHDIRINLGINFLKSLKYRVQPQQKQKWNEEDKNMLKWVIGYLENKMLNTPISEERTACKKAVDRLKSLRPQSHWRPSDEQMEAVKRASNGSRAIYGNDYLIMESLYQDLKKLSED